MNFELSDDQKAFVEAAKSFAVKELMPHAAEWDSKKFFPVDVIKKAGELGFLAVYTKSDFGGSGLSRLDGAMIFEELAFGCTSTAAYITIHNMVTWIIDSFATPDLREHYVPKMASGEILGSYCLTEPGSGSDAASLKTSAVKKGNHYVVNGSKAFVSGAGSTQVLVLMCRTGGEGAKGISALIVPCDLKGISFGENEKKMGWNSQPTRVISFDNVEVPFKNLLWEEGKGFNIAMMGLDGGRINIGTCSVGTAQAALQRAQTYMHERKQFGKSLAEFQAMQFKIADMITKITASRQMIRFAAAKLDQKDSQATAYCAMAKMFATEECFKVCDEALQIHGGYGYTQEYPLERHVRDSRVHRILEGTNEVMRMIVARKILEDGAPEKMR